MANLTVNFETDVVPAGGFRLFYRPKGSALPYTQHGVNFFVSPAVVAGVVDQDYEGYLEGDSGDGNLCPQISFATDKYSCVAITDFDLNSQEVDSIEVLPQVIFAVMPTVNQVINVNCKDLDTDTGVGTIVAVYSPDGFLVIPAEVKFTGLINGHNYRITLTSNCDATKVISADIIAGAGAQKIWVEDESVCEQDEVFTLSNEYGNFSSPAVLFYDQPTNRIYVGDHDDAAGNVYYINPDTFTGKADIQRVAFINDFYYGIVVDAQYRRIYFCGRNSGGLRVFNIADHTNQMVPYGTDGVSYNRITINVFDTTIVCIDRGAGTLTIIDRETLTVVSTKSLAAIPSGTTYLTDSIITKVGNEYWVSSEFRSVGNIAVYDTNFTGVITTIALPGIAIETSSRYRQSRYYDVVNDKFYLNDAGSSKIFVLDGASRTIVYQATIDNRQGKAFAGAGWAEDPVTNDLFIVFSMYDSPSDPAKEPRAYRQSRQTYEFEVLYPDNTFTSLVQQLGTNRVWGTSMGARSWEGIAGWGTDGKLLKYTH